MMSQIDNTPTNTNTNGKGGPWWVSFVTQVGLPGAMLAGVLWWVLTELSMRLDTLTESTEDLTRAVDRLTFYVQQGRPAAEAITGWLT